ncbi:hypothetical protein F5B22DRAFT_598067, partial [Xylaria bambusicola]|uniref:uncharacterized protein n=1 Tax=Xylaria bambusicola TaxID=326684 RepID=UPI002008C0F6
MFETMVSPDESPQSFTMLTIAFFYPHHSSISFSSLCHLRSGFHFSKIFITGLRISTILALCSCVLFFFFFFFFLLGVVLKFRESVISI